MNSIFHRVSIRKFQDKPVEHEKIETLLRAAMAAPSARNQQPWEFYVVTNKDLIQKLSTVSPYAGCAKDAPVLIVSAYREDAISPAYAHVLTCEAPNLRECPSNGMNPSDGNTAVRISQKELQALHEKRMRKVLDIAWKNGNEVVILGAFGCGAFSNPPLAVAHAMKAVVQEYRMKFETIEFAVYCSPRDDSNFRVFQNVLGSL